MNSDLEYKFILPDKTLSPFVESFWMLRNQGNCAIETVILPDGRVDLFLSKSATEPFHVTLLGIGTLPQTAVITAERVTFAISFKLTAVHDLLGTSVANLLDKAQNLPDNFWDFNAADLDDFELFVQKATKKITAFLPKEPDNRKQKLFDLIYSSHGSLSVKELSENVYWSSRQINRYFTAEFGLPLKSYSSLLRFRASFQHIRNGRLFPEQNFTDQSHFIREVKKLAGVLPKELKLNPNDRFIQFSTIPAQ